LNPGFAGDITMVPPMALRPYSVPWEPGSISSCATSKNAALVASRHDHLRLAQVGDSGGHQLIGGDRGDIRGGLLQALGLLFRGDGDFLQRFRFIGAGIGGECNARGHRGRHHGARAGQQSDS
jgi:hypothetical protein